MPKIQDCTPDFHKKFGSMVPNFEHFQGLLIPHYAMDKLPFG